MKELVFSEQYIIKHGGSVDLGDIGDISLPEVIYWNEEAGYFTAKVTYSYKGWEFANCELCVRPEMDSWSNVERAEDVFDRHWEDWTISPSKQTMVLRWGEKGVLSGTNFEEFET